MKDKVIEIERFIEIEPDVKEKLEATQVVRCEPLTEEQLKKLQENYNYNAEKANESFNMFLSKCCIPIGLGIPIAMNPSSVPTFIIWGLLIGIGLGIPNIISAFKYQLKNTKINHIRILHY